MPGQLGKLLVRYKQGNSVKGRVPAPAEVVAQLVVKVGQVCDDFCTPLHRIYTICFLVSIRINVSTHLKPGGCHVLVL